MNLYSLRFLTIFLLLTCFQNIVCAQYYQTLGTRASAMGNTSTAANDLWSAVNNQAGLANIQKPEAGIYYCASALTKELSTKAICAAFPFKPGVLSISYTYSGYSLYNIQKTGITYSMSFGEKIRTGLSLDYLQTKFGNNYGKKGNTTFEFGIQADVTDDVTIAAWTFNPIMIKFDDYNEEKIPGVLRFGMLWKISDSFILIIETEKNTNIRPLIFRGGIEYSLNNRFLFRIGTSSHSDIFTFGTGIQLNVITIGISAKMHQTLGFSPQISLIATPWK